MPADLLPLAAQLQQHSTQRGQVEQASAGLSAELSAAKAQAEEALATHATLRQQRAELETRVRQEVRRAARPDRPVCVCVRVPACRPPRASSKLTTPFRPASSAARPKVAKHTQLEEEHNDLLVLLASQEIEKNTLLDHHTRVVGESGVQEALAAALKNGALDWGTKPEA